MPIGMSLCGLLASCAAVALARLVAAGRQAGGDVAPGNLRLKRRERVRTRDQGRPRFAVRRRADTKGRRPFAVARVGAAAVTASLPDRPVG
jgi:hypothetical protein